MNKGRLSVVPDLVCGPPVYQNERDAGLPHVVKFSGGRSSAAMALSLARCSALNPERGDVVLFANTTAEHPATYEFAARVCDEMEGGHGVPCFWYEFCTVETVARNGWTRVGSYRLVRRVRASAADDPAVPGYRDDGTAFEEMVSLQGMIPNRSVRMCTQRLKLLPGLELLAHWLGGGPGPPLAGHSHPRSLVSAEDAAERSRGKRLTKAERAAVKSFAYSRDWRRPAQAWRDFTTAAVSRPASGPRPSADIAGRTGNPAKYVCLLGLRADEPARVTRAHFDAMVADGATSASCRYGTHPAGEAVATPLADHGAGKPAVDEFWRRQPYDLGIDGKAGNCVYCFMKGENALRRLAAGELTNEGPAMSGPAGIEWWADIERRYAGTSDSPNAKRFKFLSLRAPSYAEIAANPSPRNGSADANRLPCACTD